MTRTEARAIRQRIEAAARYVPEEDAYAVKFMFTHWDESEAYGIGDVVEYAGKLYKCRQAHNGQSDYVPSDTPALWALIPDPSEDGSMENPISYAAGMALENGKYYTQAGEMYLCTRDTVNPVYDELRDLVGLFVEVVI